MMIRKGCDLRQVCDAQDLIAPRQRLELFTDRFGCASTDAGVDFIENERALARRFGLLADLNGCFQGQHYARELAAGGNLLYRTQRLARIGRDQIDYGVKTCRGPVLRLVAARNLDPELR